MSLQQAIIDTLAASDKAMTSAQLFDAIDGFQSASDCARILSGMCAGPKPRLTRAKFTNPVVAGRGRAPQVYFYTLADARPIASPVEVAQAGNAARQASLAKNRLLDALGVQAEPAADVAPTTPVIPAQAGIHEHTSEAEISASDESYGAWIRINEQIEAWQTAADSLGITTPEQLREVALLNILADIRAAIGDTGRIMLVDLPDAIKNLYGNLERADRIIEAKKQELDALRNEVMEHGKKARIKPTVNSAVVEPHFDRKSQVGGDHYARLAVQPWDVMRAIFTQAEFQAFLLGNVIKYSMRDKGDRLEDLKKAQHYLATLIAEMEAVR